MSKGKHGFLWWTFIGWWWWPCRALVWDLPRAIVLGIKRLAAQEPPAVPVEAPAAPAAPVEPKAEEPLPGKMQLPDAQHPYRTYKVTGIGYRLNNLLELAEINKEYSYGKKRLIEEELVEERVWKYNFYPQTAELVPEPDNTHDPNAIRVLVDGVHVGYIKAGSCAHLLRLIQEDRIGRIRPSMGGGPYKYVSCTDYTEDGNEVYEMEQDDPPFWVHLRIEEK